MHLGVVKCDNADSDGEQSIERKIAFLYDLYSSASETIPEENLSSPQEFNDNWAEIVYLVAGSLQWMQSVNCDSKNDNNVLIHDLMHSEE